MVSRTPDNAALQLWFIALCFSWIDAYYLSANQLTFQQAQQFCRQRCNSELASMHSESDYNQIWNTIHHLKPPHQTPLLWGNISTVWLGMFQYEWNDGTGLDFGASVDTQGNFPWATDQPEGIAQCVQISVDDERWHDSPCTEHAHALCNHCNGVLNHFALVSTQKMTRSEAEVECATQYNSTLASVHNARHADEIRTLWNVTQSAAWIGLHIDSDSAAKWDDDTVFDYGNGFSGDCAPWSASQPDSANSDENCVWMNDTSSCWSVTHCATSMAYPICALTSELSTTLNSWQLSSTHVATGDNYLIANPGAHSEAYLGSKLFYNGDAPLMIEWTFTLDIIETAQPWAGVDIYNESCDWYWIGLEFVDDTFKLQVWRAESDRAMYETSLPFTVESDTDLTMLISIAVDQAAPTQPVFNVWMNEVHVTEDWTDVDGIRVFTSGHSGYIALDHGASVRCVNKALFVSGAPVEAPLFEGDSCYEHDLSGASAYSGISTTILAIFFVVVFVTAVSLCVALWIFKRTRSSPQISISPQVSAAVEMNESAQAQAGSLPQPEKQNVDNADNPGVTTAPKKNNMNAEPVEDESSEEDGDEKDVEEQPTAKKPATEDADDTQQ